MHYSPAHIYIHVPFCLKKCGYCDFYSVEDLSSMAAYVQSLCREIHLNTVSVETSPLKTLYFGGGTPSLLSPAMVEQILVQIQDCHGLLPGCEITMEVNPGTVDGNYLSAIKDLGVNRLSMGIQSFDARRLAFLSRIHSVSQAVAAIEGARMAGFDNLGLDLIYGLPGESFAIRGQEIDTALSFAPEHLSCYMLTLEPGTPLFSAHAKKAFKAQGAELQTKAFLELGEFLENRGYEHYEISNFARRGYRSRHNSAYWKMIPYGAYGPAAHGLRINVEGLWERYWNAPDTPGYINALASGLSAPGGSEILTRDQQMIEWIMVGLRTREGIDIEAFDKCLKADFKAGFSSLIENLETQGFARCQSGFFHLTRAGWARLDNIVESFFDVI